MPERINKAIELLAQDQPVYYASAHEVDYETGRQMAGTLADYINVSMEHGAFDMPGLAAFMRGLVDGGPTASGHRTPAVIVDLPPEGTSAADIRANAWVFKQALARGVHGILLCHAEDPEAVRTLVQVCRYAFRGATGGAPEGRRGAGGQGMAAHAWGVDVDEYARLADPWPLNPEGELLIGLKIENRRAVERVDETLSVPGVAFAEWGPGDMHMSFGHMSADRSYSEEIMEARRRVFDASRRNGLFFLDGTGDLVERIDAGVRIIPGAGEEQTRLGRAHTGRTMPV